MEQSAITALCGLLGQAEEQLLALEQETARLTVCPVDDVDDCTLKRLDCISRLNAVMEEVGRVCAADETGVLQLATAPDTDFDVLPDWAEPIFSARRQMNAVICRTLALEQQAEGRLRLEQERLLQEIRKNNTGTSANAARFLGALQGTEEQVFFPTKPRQI